MRVFTIFGISFSLILILSACFSTAPQTAAEMPAIQITLAPEVEASATIVATEIAKPAEKEQIAMATSRGDELVASLPSSVQVAAGRPVLIEFFRFT